MAAPGKKPPPPSSTRPASFHLAARRASYRQLTVAAAVLARHRFVRPRGRRASKMPPAETAEIVSRVDASRSRRSRCRRNARLGRGEPRGEGFGRNRRRPGGTTTTTERPNSLRQSERPPIVRHLRRDLNKAWSRTTSRSAGPIPRSSPASTAPDPSASARRTAGRHGPPCSRPPTACCGGAPSHSADTPR